MSLISRISPYFHTLTRTEEHYVHTALAEYILLGDTRKYNILIKEALSKTKITPFLHDVKSIVTEDFNSYLIWRSIYYSLREDISFFSSAYKFQVPPQDLFFCWNVLTNTVKDIVKANAQSGCILEPLTQTEFAYLLKEVEKHCNATVYQKMKFLSMNDNGINSFDLKQDLLLQASRTIRYYDYFDKDNKRDLLKIKNFTKTSISNHALNLIYKHTSKKCSKLINVTEPCGKCKNCLAGNTMKCESIIQEYAPTTLNMDILEATEKFDNVCSPDIIKELESKDWIRYVKKVSSNDINRLINIILGDSDVEFEDWAKANDKNNSGDSKKLAVNAMEYLQLDVKKVKQLFSELR